MVFWLKHFKVICPHGISPFPWIKVRRQNFSRHVWASQTSISHHHSKAEPQGPLSAVPSRLTASWGHIHQLGKGENHSPGRSVARAWGGNAAAAAKLLQSCLTLCDPRDGSPPGSPDPGRPRQEHWSGCHFLLQWMKVKVKLLSCVRMNDLNSCLGTDLNEWMTQWWSYESLTLYTQRLLLCYSFTHSFKK